MLGIDNPSPFDCWFVKLFTNLTENISSEIWNVTLRVREVEKSALNDPFLLEFAVPRAQPSDGEKTLETPLDDNAVKAREETPGPRDFADSALFDLGSGQHVSVTLWSDSASPAQTSPTAPVPSSEDL